MNLYSNEENLFKVTSKDHHFKIGEMVQWTLSISNVTIFFVKNVNTPQDQSMLVGSGWHIKPKIRGLTLTICSLTFQIKDTISVRIDMILIHVITCNHFDSLKISTIFVSILYLICVRDSLYPWICHMGWMDYLYVWSKLYFS